MRYLPIVNIYIDVSPEVPAGKVILTFIPASVHKDLESAKAILTENNSNLEELKNTIKNLNGSLGKSAFGGMDGTAYQRQVRENAYGDRHRWFISGTGETLLVAANKFS
ncbi:MAG: hypothetical protein FWD47_10985 [Treponema sp.]|nr:hypothetical protein [Treponema sp.]